MRGKRAYIREVLRDYPKIRAKPMEKRTRNEQRRFESVERMLEQVDQLQGAMEKRQLIDLVYFKQSHTLCGAAVKLYISERTSVRWNREIMCIAADSMDLM